MTTKPAFSARFARILCFATLTALVLGPALANFGLIAPLRGFMLFALALPFALATVLVGLVALFSTRKSTGNTGARVAMFATIAGALVLLFVGNLGRGGAGVPPIHDITTNLGNPPVFVELAQDPANEGVDLAFPHGPENTVELHREAYADLSSMHLMRSPADVLAQAKQVAESLGWTVIASNLPAPTGPEASASINDALDTEAIVDTEAKLDAEANVDPEAEAGTEPELEPTPVPVEATIEATATSGTFRFVDDIVIRIQGPDGADAAHSMVDIRSKSRDGQSDLGANAARIRAFIEALNQAGS